MHKASPLLLFLLQMSRLVANMRRNLEGAQK